MAPATEPNGPFREDFSSASQGRRVACRLRFPVERENSADGLCDPAVVELEHAAEPLTAP
jgi:hypothetical protein